jgi:hypothetical protein
MLGSYERSSHITKEVQQIINHKSRVENDKQSVTPTVINDSLIKQYVKQHNRDNKIFDKDDMPLWDLTHL